MSTLLVLALVIATHTVQAQPIISAENASLGNGGTAYLSGVEATFWNPANLAIHDRAGSWHITAGNVGLQYEPVLSSSAANSQFFNLTDSYYPLRSSAVKISNSERQTILDQNYAGQDLLSQHQSRADLLLAGAMWQRNNQSLSLALRARYGSRISVGRGWYDQSYISTDDKEVRPFNLVHQRNTLYEFSAGYAQEFTFFNGLFSGINKLYIGLAPKIVMAGPNLNMSYNAKYSSTNSGPSNLISKFTYRSSGKYSRATSQYRASQDAAAAIQDNYQRSFSLNPSGFGVGMDFGLTYVVPLGNTPTLNKSDSQSIVSRSIRLGLSVNDIGVVNYNENPMRLSSAKDTSVVKNRQAVSQRMFIGADGQYLSFFDAATNISNPISTSKASASGNYTSLLPGSVNAGALIELQWLKVMGDLTLGFRNTAFTTTKLAFHLGLEARPLPQIPIRTGARIADGIPTHLSIGSGIETRHWDLTAGAQFLFRSQTLTTDFVGGAFAGIQLHL